MREGRHESDTMGRVKALLLLLGIGLAVIAAALGLLAWALLRADLTALRWWAGVATVLLPVAGVVSWLLGRWQAREMVRGIDLGVERVMKAAQGTADLRTAAVREVRRPADPQPQPVPSWAREVVVVSATPALGDGRGNVIEV